MKRSRVSDTPGESEKDSAAAAPAKKIKFDENDIDYLIGDLRKEESQLVLTRLLKKAGDNFEGLLRNEIELVRHARSQLSADQIKEQVQQLQQLNALQQVQAAARLSFGGQQAPVNPAAMPSMNLALGGLGMGMGMGMGMGIGGGDVANLRSIRSQINDAFKKVKSFGGGHHGQKEWRVDVDKIAYHTGKARDQVLAGSEAALRVGLDVLEAIAEEYTERGAELGTNSIDNYADGLNKIAQELMDAFLARPSDFTPDERQGWADKVRSWDKSADEGSLFKAAAVAAKNGWEADGIVAALEGKDGTDYDEPRLLVLARIAILEREKKADQALALAKLANERCGLGQQLAKLLLRTKRLDEALASAKSIADPEQLFSLAQFAKPIDLDTAFALAVSTIAADVGGWDAANSPRRALWLIDLAVSEGKLDDLVRQCNDAVANKLVLGEVAKLLASKQQHAHAQTLAKHVLEPFSLEKLQALWNAQAERQRGGRPAKKDDPQAPATRYLLLQQVVGAAVPRGMPVWLFSQALSRADDNNADDPTVQAAVQSILDLVDDYSHLKDVMTHCLATKHYDLVNQVGQRCLDLVVADEDKQQKFLERDVRERHQLSLQPVPADRVAPQYVPHPVDYFPVSVDERRVVCEMMLKAATSHKAMFSQEILPGSLKPAAPGGGGGGGAAPESKSPKKKTKGGKKGGAKPDADSNDGDAEMELSEEEAKLEEERKANLAKCSAKISEVVELSIVKIADPNHLVHVATNSCANLQEYKLALKVLEKASAVVKELEAKIPERDEWLNKLNDLTRERDVLHRQRIQLDDDKKEELADLELKKKLYDSVTPAYTKQSSAQFGALQCRIAGDMVRHAINSKAATLPSERMSDDDIKAVIDLVLTFARNPVELESRVMAVCANEHKIHLEVGERCLQALVAMRGSVKTRVVLENEVAFIERERDALPQKPNATQKPKLADDVEARLSALQDELAALPPRPYYELLNVASVDQRVASVARAMLRSASQLRTQCEQRVDNPPPDTTPDAEAKAKADLDDAVQLEETTFQRSLDVLGAPSELQQLANSVLHNPAFVRRACQKVVAIARGLETTRAQLAQDNDEQGTLEQEQAQAAGGSAAFPQDKAQRLRELRLKRLLFLAEGNQTPNAQTIVSALASAGTTPVTAVLRVQREQAGKLHSLKHNPPSVQHLVMGLDEATARKAVEAAAANTKKQTAELDESLNKLEGELESVVMEALTVLDNPDSLVGLASQLCSPHQDTTHHNSKNLVLAKTVCEHAVGVSDALDEERLKRAPDDHERFTLEQEAHDLQKVLKTLPSDKRDRLADLQRAARLFAQCAPHLLLSADQLSAAKTRAVTTLVGLVTNSIATTKGQLVAVQREVDLQKQQQQQGSSNGGGDDDDGDAPMDQSLASLSEQMAASSLMPVPPSPEERLRALQAHLAVLERVLGETVEVVQKHLDAPDALGQACSSFAGLVCAPNPLGTAKLCVQAAEWALAKVAGLRDEAAKRDPVLTELEELEDEEEKLKEVQKKLPKAQLQRLEELRAQDYEWSLQPSYTQRTHLEHDQWAHNPVTTALQALVREKQLLAGEHAQVKAAIDAIEAKQRREAENNNSNGGGDGDADMDGGEDGARIAGLGSGELAALLKDKRKEEEALAKHVASVHERLAAWVTACMAHLPNPDHRLGITQALANNSETDLVLAAGESTIKLAVEEQRKLETCAQLQKAIFLLRLEAHELEEKREKPSSEHVRRLEQATKAFDAAPEPRYGRNTSGARQFSDGEDESVSHGGGFGGGGGGRARRGGAKYHRGGGGLGNGDADVDMETSFMDGDNEITDGSVEFVSTHMLGIVRTVAERMVQQVLNEQARFDNEKAEAERVGRPLDDADARQEALDDKLKQTTDAVLDMLEDYQAVERLLSLASSHSKHDLVLQIAESCILQVAEMRKARKAVEDEHNELAALEAEKQLVESQRKSLSPESLARFQHLQLERGLRTVLPGYKRRSTVALNNVVFRVFHVMMLEALNHEKRRSEEMDRERMNPRLVRGESVTESQLEREHGDKRSQMKEDIQYVMELCTANIEDCGHLVQLVRELNDWKHYASLIHVGTRAQEVLAEELEVEEQRAALRVKETDLRSKQISTTSIDKDLQDVIDKLKELGPSKFSAQQLRQWVLDVANLMIDAARLEAQDDVVLVQSILVFKMMLTLEKFEEVHTLCPKKDWPKVKKDLLDYVKNHDTTLPGSPINLKMQIELLLSQDMWQAAIDIFPEPQPNDSAFNTQGLEIIELIWVRVEQADDKELEQLLPCIERYARKEYQTFTFKALDRLLDLVQVKYPDFIIELHKIGSDIMASNMAAKHYELYCTFLKGLRQRLAGIGMNKQWDSFIQGIRKEHARKKKLINIFNAHEL